MPVRIYDIAKKLGLENKEVLAKAKELGITAGKVPSSSLDKITAEFLEEQLAAGIKKTQPPAPLPPPFLPTPIIIVSQPVVEPIPIEPTPAPAETIAPLSGTLEVNAGVSAPLEPGTVD